MSNVPVMISAISMSVPDTVVTNNDIATFLDTNDEWIRTRTGIRERRVVRKGETAVTLGVDAALKVLKKTGLNPDEIDLIITATSAPTHIYPSTSCEIQAEIGADNAACFDITAACSGMIYGISIAKAYINAGTYKNVLLVMTDTNSRFVDWTDRGTCILFGDGAGAMILQASTDGIDDIVAIDTYSKGSIGSHILMPLNGDNYPNVEQEEKEKMKIYMDGREVYKFVVTILPNDINKTLQKAGKEPKDMDYLVMHQANQRIIDAVQARLKFTKEQVISNIEYFGNTSAASVSIAIVDSWQKGLLKTPSTALLT